MNNPYNNNYDNALAYYAPKPSDIDDDGYYTLPDFIPGEDEFDLIIYR
jgi:hypothetical protein